MSCCKKCDWAHKYLCSAQGIWQEVEEASPGLVSKLNCWFFEQTPDLGHKVLNKWILGNTDSAERQCLQQIQDRLGYKDLPPVRDKRADVTSFFNRLAVMDGGDGLKASDNLRLKAILIDRRLIYIELFYEQYVLATPWQPSKCSTDLLNTPQVLPCKELMERHWRKIYENEPFPGS